MKQNTDIVCLTRTYTVLVSKLEKAMAPHSVLLPGKSHGQRSLVDCSPWGCTELNMTERLHFHFSLSCIGEGNGNPLQCSCLENPRDGVAWWAAVYGVTQSQTRLKRLSSSSNVVWLPENGHKIQNVFLVPWKYYSYRRVLTLNAFLGVLFTYKRKKQGSSMG